jgi:hypothetical protein
VTMEETLKTLLKVEGPLKGLALVVFGIVVCGLVGLVFVGAEPPHADETPWGAWTIAALTLPWSVWLVLIPLRQTRRQRACVVAATAVGFVAAIAIYWCYHQTLSEHSYRDRSGQLRLTGNLYDKYRKEAEAVPLEALIDKWGGPIIVEKYSLLWTKSSMDEVASKLSLMHLVKAALVATVLSGLCVMVWLRFGRGGDTKPPAPTPATVPPSPVPPAPPHP